MNIFHIPDIPTKKGLAYIPRHVLGDEKRSGYFNSHYGRILVDDLWSAGPFFEVVNGTARTIDEREFNERFWELQDHPAIKRFVPIHHGIAVLARVVDVDLRCTTFQTYYGDSFDKVTDSFMPGDVIYVGNVDGLDWLSIVEAINRF